MKKVIGPVLSLLLVALVGVAVYDSLKSQSAETITGLIGSEKQAFFDDVRVQKRFKELGFEVNYQKAGSREIATNYNLSEFDYAFPAGVPAAEKIRQQVKGTKSYSPFYTPMAIASWQPIVDILIENGLATKKADYTAFDMKAYLDAFSQQTRWKELSNSEAYPVNKPLLINSTDIGKSNSAAMYLGLASYVVNDFNIVESIDQSTPLLPELSDLFKRQGYVESSSAVPFQDFLIMGMGKAPLVMIYESQLINTAALNDGSMTDDMVMIYPEPSIFSKHTLVGLSENGSRFGELLETDEELQKLAIEYGFRNRNTAYFREFTKSKDIDVPASLVNVVEPPSYEVIESMIQHIERQY